MKNKILTQKNSDLPENVLQRCERAGQPLHTLDLTDNYVRCGKRLPHVVTNIRMAYPFKVERGSYNVYEIAPAKTWGELLTEVVKVFQRECKAGKNTSRHALEDFIISSVDVHPNDLATIEIDS